MHSSVSSTAATATTTAATTTAMSAYMVESVETNKGLLFMYSTAPSAAVLLQS